MYFHSDLRYWLITACGCFAIVFEITDRIDIKVSSNKLFDEAITEFNQYISGQVLADSIVIDEGPFEDEIEIDEEKITMSILKIK